MFKWVTSLNWRTTSLSRWICSHSYTRTHSFSHVHIFRFWIHTPSLLSHHSHLLLFLIIPSLSLCRAGRSAPTLKQWASKSGLHRDSWTGRVRDGLLYIKTMHKTFQYPLIHSLSLSQWDQSEGETVSDSHRQYGR